MDVFRLILGDKNEIYDMTLKCMKNLECALKCQVNPLIIHLP